MTSSNALRKTDYQNVAISPAAIDALTSAISSEVRLLEDLIGVMRKQRSSVATDDLQGVDDSVFATHRILVTLGEARRQRRSLAHMLGGTDDVGLHTLDDLLQGQMTDGLRAVREDLVSTALTLSREVEMNRQVLRGALSSGGELMRDVYGATEPKTYRPDHVQDREAAGGLLINRQV